MALKIRTLPVFQVFQAKHMRSSSTTYLTALAFADSLFLLSACLFYSPRPLTWLSTNQDPNFEVGTVLQTGTYVSDATRAVAQ